MTMLLLLVLGSTDALAGDKLVATKVDGVTLDQVKAATAPIPLARAEPDGKHVELRCAGATGELVCELWNTDSNTLLAASSDLKLCRDGNDVAVMSEKEGVRGRMIIIPTGLFIGDPAKRAVCGG
jgi:hypothetical protein